MRDTAMESENIRHSRYDNSSGGAEDAAKGRRTKEKVSRRKIKADKKSDRNEPQLSPAQEDIAEWMKSVRFRKALLGGVSESDVWKKIDELNSLYEAALAAERVRYDALLKERVPAQARVMARQMYDNAVRRQAQAAQEKVGEG